MWMEHLLSGETRETLDKFDVKVWAFPDHIEARGMIPTQTVQRVFTYALIITTTGAIMKDPAMSRPTMSIQVDISR